MKKCQNCPANNNNMFCRLTYKTEILSDIVRGYKYDYISPLEKCNKPKNIREYIRRYKNLN